jgi:hypothetical protein
MKEINNAEMHSVYALAFALLECRSEKEALQVIKYFAKAKSPVSAPSERDDQHDGLGAHWR